MQAMALMLKESWIMAKRHDIITYISVFARIERGQGADLGKGHFCARPIILRALLRVILHFEGTFTRDFTF